MSLRGWQAALVGLLAGDEAVPAGDDLTATEAAWLATVRSTPGYALTSQVQRQWRAFRVRSCLPLTARLLGARFEPLVAAYVEDRGEPASFFLREAEQFVEHSRAALAAAASADDRLAHADAVTRFELAMTRPHAGARGGPELIGFLAPPGAVLGRLAAGRRPPPPAPRPVAYLRCGAGTCRLASGDELAASQ